MIRTPRLYLRPWQPTDLPALPAILGCAEVMRFSMTGPLSDQEQQRWLSAACLRAPETLAIEETETRGVIGYIGLTHHPDRIGPSDRELGFRLARHVWGRGIATEAARAVVETQHHPKVRRIVAIVDPSNQPSVRVLGKIGMRYVQDLMLPGYDYPDHLHACPAPGSQSKDKALHAGSPQS